MDYYYRQEAEMFTFFRMPKLLFSDDRYKSLPTDAKLLYGLMIDRMELSLKNGWQDAEGKTYIYMRQEEAMEILNVKGTEKIVKLYKALETVGLLERKRQGLGRPDRLYVGRLTPIPAKIESQTIENQESRLSKIESPELQKTKVPYLSKTEKNSLYKNQSIYQHASAPITPLIPTDSPTHEEAVALVESNIDTAYLLRTYPDQQENILGMVDIIVDELTSNRPTVRIGGADRPRRIVRERLKRVTTTEVEAIAIKLEEHDPANEITNWRGYLLTCLYTSPSTAEQVLNPDGGY